MVLDRNISITCAAAAAAWLLGLALIILDVAGVGDLDSLGLGVMLIGGVLSMRMTIGRLANDQAEAFNLGRDSVARIRSGGHKP